MVSCCERRPKFLWTPVYVFLLLSGVFLPVSRATDNLSIDVTEGENVTLECRFNAKLLEPGVTLFWIRSNRKGHDNVAIGQTPFENQYRVELSDNGRYDLRIVNATYDRDNGEFECRIKKDVTGESLHTESVRLTVLLRPSPPQITPTNALATEGRVTNLTCSSLGGSPPPTIHWYKEGQSTVLESTMMHGANKDVLTKSVLSILPSKKDDGSAYRCTVWNRALGPRQKLETRLKVHVNYFPRVTVGPKNPLKVERDETTELECNVDSKPSVSSVKWMRNGRFIETHFKHIIPRVTLQDAGVYVCSADNGLGQEGESELKLDVLYGPVIDLPEEKEVSAGEDVVVECNVSANPRPTLIQWLKVGDSIFKQNGATLRLKSVTASNNGPYICSATNHLTPTGRETAVRTGNGTIVINVRHKPGKAIITPEEPVAVEGRSITLTCGADPPGFPASTYTWTKEGRENTLAIGEKFTIGSARLNHAGNYQCQPNNALGKGSRATVSLQVHQAPKIITQLQPTVMKRAGDTGFHITCSAVSKPKPKVHWFKNGQEIKDDESNLYQINTTEQENIPNMAYNVLSTLRYVGPERISANQLMPTDRGHYTCQFENSVAKTESTMLLRIEHSPVVVHQHNKVAYDLGDTAYISCKMQAYPSPRFDWSYGNSILQNDYYDTNITALGDDIYQGILKIYKVTENSYGEYNCKGINIMGAKKTIIKLQPKGKPERPSSIHPVEIGYNYIVIGWTPGFNGGYNDTFFTVQYRKEDSVAPDYDDCRYRNPCNLSNLEQNSKYNMKIKASNNRGESKFSRETTIATKIDVSKIPKPQSVHFEKLTNTASFNAYMDSKMSLVAKIELENSDGTWNHYNEVSMAESTFGEIVVDGTVNNLRVRYCLETNDVLCGPYADAQLVDILPSTAQDSGQIWVIVIIIFIAVIVVISIAIVIRCCCCSKQKKTNVKKGKGRPNIVHSTDQPPPYTLENKGVDTLKDADEVALKNNLVYNPHQNGYEQEYPPPQEPQSNSHSANSGSVNSQDSLWNVKSNGGEPMMMRGGVAPPPQPGPMQQPQQQQQPQPPQQQQIYAYDQRYVTTQNQDYAQYPYPEDYLNDRNRQYIATDAYGIQQQRMDSDYSPYGDVSGLPDPYMGQLDEDPSVGQPSQATPYDENGIGANGGEFASPRGRRIIREIIV